jgi:hypothetical protein
MTDYTGLRRLADGPPLVFASTSLGERAGAHAARFVRAYAWFDALLGHAPEVGLLVLDEAGHRTNALSCAAKLSAIRSMWCSITSIAASSSRLK